MAAGKPEKTNAMRALDARRIPYDVYRFSLDIHSAAGVATELGIPPDEVYKTLVVVRPSGKPLLILVAGDCKLDLKAVARAAGEKWVRMATHREAEDLTGLRVGGISALALLARSFDVLIDRPALDLSHVLVSAGKRGINLRIAVPHLVQVTGGRIIDATAKRANGG